MNEINYTDLRNNISHQIFLIFGKKKKKRSICTKTFEFHPENIRTFNSITSRFSFNFQKKLIDRLFLYE